MGTKINIDGEIYENDVRIMHELTLGSVTIGATPSATITNVSGSATLDLVLPEGPTGPVGPTGNVQVSSITGTGNFVTDIDVTGNTITIHKDETFLTNVAVTGAGNVVRDISSSGPTATVTKAYAFDTITVTGSGNAVTSATSVNNEIILTKGETFLETVTPTGIVDGLGFMPYHIEIGPNQPSGPTVWFEATSYSSNPDGSTSSTSYSSNKSV
jgi:hypothetical protein